MNHGLHQFASATIQWLKHAASQPHCTRGSLARGLCEKENWVGATGQPCLASARKALPVLATRLGLQLPAPQTCFGDRRGGRDPELGYADVSLQCDLSQLGEVSVVPVSGPEDRRRWESMMATHHPQGWARAPGGQQRYWVMSAVHGRLGGIGFCAASWHQRTRDEFIGWSAEARVANLDQVVNNQRFLMLPGVRVPGLASQVLGLACGRVASDWQRDYNTEPVLVYTYVSTDYAGTCYREAGWQRGERLTCGRPPGKTGGGPVRAVWMKPLVASWRSVLCAEPVRCLRVGPALYLDEDSDWAQQEYVRCTHPDGRTRARIESMGRAWIERPGESLPMIFPNPAARRAAYRLLKNRRVKMEHITEGSLARLVEHGSLELVILAIQDSTTLNYAGRVATEGLSNIGGGGGGVSGMKVHLGLAVNGAGRPLGVYSIDTANYSQSDELASQRWVHGLERAAELEQACEGPRVVTVCDREGDFWELLEQAVVTQAGLLVRSNGSYQRRVLLGDGTRPLLWEHLGGQAVLAEMTVEVLAHGGPHARAGRQAKVALRAAWVELLPPRRHSKAAPIQMLAVSATELDPPAEVEPLHWVLLTTEGDTAVDDVTRIVGWYALRWTIEEFFRTLKTYTRIEDHRLTHADELGKCLAFDAITACHVYSLDRLARERPQLAAAEVVDDDELVVLDAKLAGHGMKPTDTGELRNMHGFVVDVGRLAGFHPRRSQPLPGISKLWEGYKILREATHTYQSLRKKGIIKNE